jgi:DNA-3-methyladenine glycosylase II
MPRATPAAPAPAPAAGQEPAASITPAFWDDACRHLARRDRVMKKLIPRFGQARLESRGDAFTTLARSIVGQQISVKAAQSIWDRFVHAAGVPAALRPAGVPAALRPAGPPAALQPAGVPGALRPADVGALPLQTIRACGLSARKAEYLLDLARHFNEGAVHEADWREMDDDVIVRELVAIRGIGRWTAEMFLIFHLLRPNVMPLDDLGLLKGISVNYFSGEPVSRAEAREVGEAWAPFRSVATWYIWRSLDPLPVAY